MSAADRGPWLQTYTGKHFYPFDPQPEEIDIWDIAHALSNECRWGGHTERFYSVAAHSLAVAGKVQRHGQAVALRALLHDGSEAYLRDIPRPLKMHPSMQGYRDIERLVQAAIYRRFDLGFAPAHDDLVHVADDEVLCEEAYGRLSGGPIGWVPEGGPLPFPRHHLHWGTPEEDRDRFLMMYLDLSKAIASP